VSIHSTSYPAVPEDSNLLEFNKLDDEVKKLFEVIDIMRKYKADNQIKMSLEVDEINVSGTNEDIEVLKKYSDSIK